MTLFTLLLVLAWERLFKLGEHWQLDHRLEVVFQRLHRVSLAQTLAMTAAWMVIVWGVLWLSHGLFFGVVTLLLWINVRYYLAPLFWFVVFGPYGPIALAGYAFLRAYQTWLARHNTPLERSQSGIDHLLNWLDWIPVRLAGVAYALFGHGERALPAWFASLGDRHSSSYQVLTRLAQFSLARDPHMDPVQTPRAAVTMARKLTMIIVVVVALLTIYGTLL